MIRSLVDSVQTDAYTLYVPSAAKPTPPVPAEWWRAILRREQRNRGATA